MFAALGLMVLVHVHGFGYAVYAFDVVGRLEVSLFYLQLDKASGKCYSAYVVTRTCLYCHDVAFAQGYNVIEMTEMFEHALRDISQNANSKMVFFDIAMQTIILITRKK